MARRHPTLRRLPPNRLIGILVIAGILILVPGWLSYRTFVARSGTARLYFSTPYTQVQPNQDFTIDLRVDTGGHAVNAVQSALTLDPTRLQIVNMTTDRSFCTLYTENSFDANRGTVDIACGTPHPGFAGDSLVVSLTLRAKMAGDATIGVEPSSALVLADDGKGTNLLGSAPSYLLSVKQASY